MTHDTETRILAAVVILFAAIIGWLGILLVQYIKLFGGQVW